MEYSEMISMMEHFKLSEASFNRQVSDSHIEEISDSFCEKWRSLPPYLEMETIVMKDIDRDHPGEEREKRCSFLKKWKKMKGLKATYKSLIHALLQAKCREEAEGVCKLLRKVDDSALSDQATEPPLSQELSDTKGKESMNAPSLDTLDPKVRVDLKHQLKLNFKQISKQYASYVSYIRRVIKREVSPGELCAYLLGLPALKSGESDQQVMLLSEISDKLEKATTVDDIFNVLNRNYATFLNYEIFQCIAEEYEVDPDHEKMKYPEYLDDYINKHKLSELIDENPLLKNIECGTNEMVLKFDIAMTCSLAKLQEYTSNIADILGLRPSALRLLSIEEGCVVITLLIPAPVADFIFNSEKKFTTEEIKQFQGLSILWLKCNGHEYDFSEEHNGQNPMKESQSTNSGASEIANSAQVVSSSMFCPAGPPDLTQYLFNPLQHCNTRNIAYLVNTLHCDTTQDKTALGRTLVHAACSGHLAVVKFLIEDLKCEPESRDSNGVTPLHVAAAKGQIEIVRYFISTKSCDPRVKTSENATPLDFAAANGHEVTAKYLLDSYQCDARLKNTDILSAKELAFTNGHYNVSLLLQFVKEEAQLRVHGVERCFAGEMVASTLARRYILETAQTQLVVPLARAIVVFESHDCYSEADIMNQLSSHTVHVLSCAGDVMSLIAEIGESLNDPEAVLKKVQKIEELIANIEGLAKETESVDMSKVSAVSQQLSLMAEFQLKECAEYPDLWPFVVDELLRVIDDLAESVRNDIFIQAIESSNPYFQDPPQPQPVPMPESVSPVSEIPEASASALPPYLNPMAKHATPQQDQGCRFFRKHLDEVRDTLYEKDN